MYSTMSYRVLGRFHAKKGIYTLDLEILADQSRLNSREPYLLIEVNGGRQNNAFLGFGLAVLSLLLLAPISTCMLIQSAILRRQEKQDVFLQHWSLTQPGPAPALPGLSSRTAIGNPRPKLPLARPRSPALSSFGLIAALTYLVILIPLWLLQAAAHAVSTPSGLRVRLIRSDIRTPRSPGIQPLLVRVIFRRPTTRPDLYVGSQLVSREELVAALEKEIKLRPPDWPVYLEGDPGLAWRSVAEVIDAIRGLQAEVVLVHKP